MRALARPRASISIIGKLKEAVLPVPVCAMPMTSRRMQHMGNALCLDGRGRGVAALEARPSALGGDEAQGFETRALGSAGEGAEEVGWK